MPEVRLSDIRVGYSWTGEVTYPTGFLAAGESVKLSLKRHVEAPVVFLCNDERVGDVVTWSLSGGLTGNMTPGTYIGEAVVYKPLDASYEPIPLTTNRYILEADDSPAEV